MHTDPVTTPIARFQHTLATRQHRNPASVPVQLAQAATVLGVDGVGLLTHKAPDQWTPLAASNETAALVTCLDRAVGDGPCQEAARTSRAVIATQEHLTRQWPVFTERLLDQTPIRSILVMPLSGRLHGRGFVMFCSVAPDGVTTLPMIQLCIVTGLLSQELGSLPATVRPRELYENRCIRRWESCPSLPGQCPQDSGPVKAKPLRGGLRPALTAPTP
jgi:hypothetical protein